MFTKTKVCTGVLAALGGALLMTSAPVLAQGEQRVEITGSAIKRIDAETSLPVTIVRTEDLIKQGITTAEGALSRIAANQSNFGASQSIGGTTGGKAEADLRGLSGPTGTNANKTLVLLNGRRLANHSFDAAAVDLNAIPLYAVDRIEILRDGASAIYGTDAIGGVINFILRRDFQGVEASASYSRPEAGPEGDIVRASIAAGFGSLTEDKFNVLASLDYRKQSALKATDRAFGSTGILGTTRTDITNGTSGTAYPGDVGGFEPSAPNCDPPLSVPRNTNPDNTGAFNSCRYDFTRAIDLIPENEQLTYLLRGSLALSADHTLTGEYMRANNKSTSRVAPAPTGHLLPQSSPFWPTGATAGPIPDILTSDPDDTVPGGVANWRQVPAGQRTSGDDTYTDRLLLDLEGIVAGWDYRSAFGRSKNKSTADVKRGYVNDDMMQDGVWRGVINPFGTHGAANMGQTAAGVAAIEAAQVVAPTLIGENTLDFFDARVSKNLFNMDGGAAAGSFGFEWRREKSNFVATDITAQLSSLGIDSESDTSGSRHSTAFFAELALPITKTFEASIAARYDDYSDFGGTFNPKVSAKWTPMPGMALRGSYNTGFRAPTLYEIYQPASLTFTTDNYDDPLLCPGGTAVPGASAGVVCGQQVLQQTAGPAGLGRPAKDLQPEESNQFSVGLVFEPVRGLSMTVDYFDIKIKNTISSLPEQAIFGNATKYAGKFVRCSQLPASGSGTTRDDIDVCLNYPGFDPIAYIDAPVENLGNLNVSGVDLSLAWRSSPSSAGVFGIVFDGTYLTQYEYQREKGGEYIDAIGRYSDNAPVFRWQHVLQGSWSIGNWSTVLVQRYKTGYTDQNEVDKVDDYLIHDLSTTWSGVKGLALTFGINNVFDEDPPRTMQTTTFQRGYDPRFTDPLGRGYFIRAGYKFF